MIWFYQMVLLFDLLSWYCCPTIDPAMYKQAILNPYNVAVPSIQYNSSHRYNACIFSIIVHSKMKLRCKNVYDLSYDNIHFYIA